MPIDGSNGLGVAPKIGGGFLNPHQIIHSKNFGGFPYFHTSILGVFPLFLEAHPIQKNPKQHKFNKAPLLGMVACLVLPTFASSWSFPRTR